MTIAADTIVLGLGGNVGGDQAVLERMRRVAESFASFGRVRASRVYRTAPIGGPEQDDYLNAALAIDARPAPTPRELIETVHELERMLGRARSIEVHWGPRSIDIDVLLWGPREIDEAGPPWLRVPHERFAERRFALAPAADLFGEDLMVPGEGLTLRELLDAAASQRIETTELVIV